MDYIVYHGNCPDGFCAAYVAKKKYPDAVLIPAVYGTKLDIPENSDILMVDFSLPRTELISLKNKSKSLLVLDHHKTAETDLKDLDFALFDMNKSGAGITWDTLFSHDSRPWYVNYVEDRDLWNWKLPRSKEVSGYLMALPHTIEAWDKLGFTTWEKTAEAGEAIRLHIESYISRVKEQKSLGDFEGYKTAVVNAAYPNISDVCNDLLSEAEIGLGWFERGDGMIQFSLRSNGNPDVSLIAKKFGGGGHKAASGFQLNYKEGRSIIDSILGRDERTI